MSSPDRIPFDQAICNEFRERIQVSIQLHPELRSVAVTFDYHGQLNEARINQGLWLGEDGPVASPDALLGSAYSTLLMLSTQIDRAEEILKKTQKAFEELHLAVLQQAHQIDTLVDLTNRYSAPGLPDAERLYLRDQIEASRAEIEKIRNSGATPWRG